VNLATDATVVDATTAADTGIAVTLAGRPENKLNEETLTTVRQLTETTRRNLTNLTQLDENLTYLLAASPSMRQDSRLARLVGPDAILQNDIMFIIGELSSSTRSALADRVEPPPGIFVCRVARLAVASVRVRRDP
jgi:hypothetical protein